MHLTPLQLSMHADGALIDEDAQTVIGHLASCTECQAALSALQMEANFVTSALQITANSGAEGVEIRKFSRPMSLRNFAMANLMTGLVIWLAQFLWKTIFGELVMNATSWVTSVYLPDFYAVTSASILFLLEEGTSMFDNYIGIVVVSLLTAGALWFAIRRRLHAAVGACALVVASGSLVLPQPVDALELRRSDGIVAIAATETVDDSMMIAAETVLIEGNITGDVFATGQRINVSGNISGTLIAFAESVTIRGSVGGMAMGGASAYNILGGTVAGDVWVAGEKITVDEATKVGRNLVVASQSVSLGGSVGKDLYTITESVEVSGDVARHLEAYSNRVKLLGDAHIGGDVRFRGGNDERLHRSASVTIDGEVQFPDMPEEMDDGASTIEFVSWQVAKLIAALIVGLLLLWLVPGFKRVSIGAGIEGLKTAGIGFVALVSVPLMAIIIAITLVGIPVALIAFASWLLALYLAKIVVGVVVGNMLLGDRENVFLPLLVGLVIVLLVSLLPFIGGAISFVLTIVGLGLIVQYLLGALPQNDDGAFDDA